MNKRSRHKSRRNGPRAAAVPAGFHPLSKTMAAVLVALQRKFVNVAEGYQRDEVRELALEYYQALRRMLRRSTPGQRLLTRCCHCGIFF